MRAIQLKTNRSGTVSFDVAALADFRGEVIVPDDQRYLAARALWNGMIDRSPGLILRCQGVADVMAAVKLASQLDLVLAVRGGGHNVAGFASCEGGLVIDLSHMRAVRVDPVRRTVRAEGGARFADLDRETQVFGLATPGGLVSATGIGGFTLGGGLGWLLRRFGTASDNLVSADVVTAQGELVTASPESNPDLFWALRGGGGNFGVVTSFEYRLHPVGPEVYMPVTFYPGSESRRVMARFRDFMKRAPDELSLLCTLWSVPEAAEFPAEHRGRPMIAVVGCYTGEADGEQLTRPLREISAPIIDLSSRIPYVKGQQFFDPDYPDGMLYYWKSHNLRELSDEVIALLSDRALQRPSPLTSIDLWALGGAFSRVAPEATAFANRQSPFMVAIESNWKDPAESDRNVAWTREVWSELERFSSGLYLNFPGLGEAEVGRSAFGPSYQRLAQVKTRYDPGNLFRSNVNIRPG